MDWEDSAEQASFRAQVRELIENGLPDYYRRLADGPVPEIGSEAGWGRDRKSDNPEARAAAKEWGDTLGKRGWFAPQWPKEYGGGGLTPMEMFIFREECAKTGAPAVGGGGVTMLGPTIMVHGTDEQKKKFLLPILSGAVMYGQGYSEPGAGSDLASLQTRAVRDGDEFVINGQKLWGGGKDLNDAVFALVRTDPDAPKHRGITLLVIEDIHTPGLETRLLLNMADNGGFSESFYEDVRVPVANAVGEVNRGWYVGATLLDYERAYVIVGAVERRRTIGQMLNYIGTEDGRMKSKLQGREESDALRHEVADRYIETEVGHNFCCRIISMQNRGLIPNYEASMTKAFITEAQQKMHRTGTKVFGLYSNVWDPDDQRSAMGSTFTEGYITSMSATIGAGTSEIQRNIIATRGLGLPRG